MEDDAEQRDRREVTRWGGPEPSPASPLTAAWFGRVAYETAWSWQRRLFRARQGVTGRDCLMLLEHPPTYTLGRRGVEDDIRYGPRELVARGIATFRVDRGGRATYHGPGQLVGYPIVRLGERYDVLAYLRALETTLIGVAARYGVEAERDRAHTGVWVGDRKLAAIGVKITRGITMHGFALNVTTDLGMFDGIVPCGIPDRGVTSLRAERGASPSVRAVAAVAAHHLARALGRSLVWSDPGGLLSAAHDTPVGVPAG
jgi:lipoyl(octanoyl) transferase